MIAGVFLAAGLSRRFGTDKLLHEVSGHPIVYYSLRSLVQSNLSRIYVIVAADNHALRSTVERYFPANKKLIFVENDRPESGMMSSLKLGIEAAGNCEGVMVCLADMPRVTAEIINTLLAAFVKGKIIVPTCDGRPYHPRVLPRPVFPDFLHLQDDEKGSRVLALHEEIILRLPVGKKHNYVDIDNLADLDEDYFR